MSIQTVAMPPEGLFRAGRWGDIEKFPHPAPAIAGLALTEPLLDGPRWEDTRGSFATVKCSRSSEAAIGRIFARFRPGPVPIEQWSQQANADPDLYGGMLNRMLEFLDRTAAYEHEPDLKAEEGSVPAGIFPRLCEIHLPAELGLTFVDVEAHDTQAELAGIVGDNFRRLGLRDVVGNNLARESDRRLPRLVVSLLHDLYSGEHAGIRVAGQPDDAWESFVLWSPPGKVDLAADSDSFRWVAAWDDDAVKAAATLGVRLPED